MTKKITIALLSFITALAVTAKNQPNENASPKAFAAVNKNKPNENANPKAMQNSKKNKLNEIANDDHDDDDHDDDSHASSEQKTKLTKEQRIEKKNERLAGIKERKTKIQAKIAKINKTPVSQRTDEQKAKLDKLTTRLAMLSENETKVNKEMKQLKTASKR